jgi:uncharacterized protein (DUF1778 family)
MPTIDMKFTDQEFAALAMQAHLEGVTLNELIVSVLTDEAKKSIENYERSEDAESSGNRRKE